MIEFTAERYVEEVLAGRVVACQAVRHACERHRRDLTDGAARGLHFDEATAQIAIAFFELLKHSKGEWAGQTIRLEPWQQFIIWSLFGWKRADGTRRFRTGYLEVARKNGKSTVAAGIGLFLMAADGEPGAEIYSAATKKDQARITHAEATRMVKASPHLRRILTVYRDNIHIKDTASKYEPLGRDTDSLDGLNVHGGIIDEVHAHKTRELWDLLETATGSRRQPLMLAITTAGYNRQSLCWSQHEYTLKILDGLIEDDSWFGIIFSLDEDDDWQDESVWGKANPNLGVSKKLDDMRRLAKRAKEMPSALNSFLRLHCDLWTQAETKWINRQHWDACGIAVDALGLRGRTAFGGLDLSSTSDITALLWVFPPQSNDDPYKILCRFWVPEEAMVTRSHNDHVPYEAWVRAGYITATPGNVIDYDYILKQVEDDLNDYDIPEVAFDRWGASRIQTQLAELGEENFLVQFGQGFASMSGPMKELERLIASHGIAHGNNPVLNWMADNLVVRTDPAGNIKPDKARSLEKIDGMVALVMALDRATRHVEEGSAYDEHGVRSV